jgi:hypothetical protein
VSSWITIMRLQIGNWHSLFFELIAGMRNPEPSDLHASNTLVLSYLAVFDVSTLVETKAIIARFAVVISGNIRENFPNLKSHD